MAVSTVDDSRWYDDSLADDFEILSSVTGSTWAIADRPTLGRASAVGGLGKPVWLGGSLGVEVRLSELGGSAINGAMRSFATVPALLAEIA